jgi:putative glycosyltransferase
MKVSIVATLFHSQDYINEFYERSLNSMTDLFSDYEFVFVNDGSPDHALQKALEIKAKDNNITIVDLSRNFGHHKAMMTGLQFAHGDYVYLIDIDLEEDPELIREFWKEFEMEKNLDVVYGIQIKRKGKFFERISGKVYYKLVSFLTNIDYPADTLTARLMSKRYVDNLLKYKEKELDIWGIFALTGFKQKGIPVTKRNKGSSTYTFKKKVKHALDSVTSLSSKPLYYIFIIGFMITLFSVINIIFILFRKIIGRTDVEGWSSILASIWLLGGLIMFTLGIIGIYLSKIFLEIKNRPITVIRDVYK